MYDLLNVHGSRNYDLIKDNYVVYECVLYVSAFSSFTREF